MAVYTTSWKPVTPEIGLQAIDSVSTTQNHPLGKRIRAVDVGANQNGEGDFLYVKGVGAAAVGDWVTINEDDYSTTLLAANAIGKVGICMAALIVSTYGWVQIRGKAVGKAATGYADNGLVYATATAGTVDDAAVAGDRVKKAIGASALNGPATGKAEFEIDNPFMDDASAA